MIDAEHIKQLCKEQGTTMTAVAKRMYPSAKQPLSQLSTALRGNPRLDWIERLAKKIGCDTGTLLAATPRNTIVCPKCGYRFKVEIKVKEDLHALPQASR